MSACTSLFLLIVIYISNVHMRHTGTYFLSYYELKILLTISLLRTLTATVMVVVYFSQMQSRYVIITTDLLSIKAEA